jgi:hypothetical protein
MPRRSTCVIESCEKEAKAPRGWCWKHYNHWRRQGDPLAHFTQAVCDVEGCTSPSRANDMCDKHYRRVKSHGDPSIRLTMPAGICSEAGCETQTFGRGLCQRHYYAMWVSSGGRQKVSATMGRRRAKLAGATIVDTDLTWATLILTSSACYICGRECDPSDYRQIINRGGWTQKICGPAYPTLDHIVPVSKGGDHSADNAALACMGCNRTKSAKVARDAPQLVQRSTVQGNAQTV